MALNVFMAFNPDKPIMVGQLSNHNRQIYFEYDSDWIRSGFALSPYHLPLSPGVLKDNTGIW